MYPPVTPMGVLYIPDIVSGVFGLQNPNPTFPVDNIVNLTSLYFSVKTFLSFCLAFNLATLSSKETETIVFLFPFSSFVFF